MSDELKGELSRRATRVQELSDLFPSLYETIRAAAELAERDFALGDRARGEQLFRFASQIQEASNELHAWAKTARVAVYELIDLQDLNELRAKYDVN